MNFEFPAYPFLERTVIALKDLASELVFVGGSAIGLYLTEPQVRDPRPTEDVDVICEAFTRADWYGYCERIRLLGFAEDVESQVICRFRRDDLVIDVMPLSEDVLGFSNRWYEYAFENASRTPLANGLEIRLPDAATALACKVEAFADRGKDDFYVSKDFEDIVMLLDGRAQLGEEVQSADADLRHFLQSHFRTWLERTECLEAVAGHLPPDAASQARRTIVFERMSSIAGLTQT
ncbi:MAG: nucleotidyl transferase AbiEii/AbiGii toxin family protein [Armatimonadetes bacterium]|nr:nucleotidyl transferase AbiEii/AbiGii toxin family protein [Armatimonadota bacterium]